MTRPRQIALSVCGSIALFAGIQGCASERPDAIGASAIMETSGNKVVSWTASANGKLTVFDKNTDKVVYGGNILSSQSVRVDVDNNRIMLDSQIVSENSLHGGDEYRIYFEPTGVVQQTSTVETHTMQTNTMP